MFSGEFQILLHGVQLGQIEGKHIPQLLQQSRHRAGPFFLYDGVFPLPRTPKRQRSLCRSHRAAARRYSAASWQAASLAPAGPERGSPIAIVPPLIRQRSTNRRQAAAAAERLMRNNDRRLTVHVRL